MSHKSRKSSGLILRDNIHLVLDDALDYEVKALGDFTELKERYLIRPTCYEHAPIFYLTL